MKKHLTCLTLIMFLFSSFPAAFAGQRSKVLETKVFSENTAISSDEDSRQLGGYSVAASILGLSFLGGMLLAMQAVIIPLEAIMAVLGVVFCLGGIVLGILGFRKAKKAENKKQKWLARIGIVLGAAPFVYVIIALLGLWITQPFG